MSKYPLREILTQDAPVEYTFDGYTVCVSESIDGQGYDLTIQKEAMPPHVTKLGLSIDEIESYLNGSLGYQAGASVWQICEED